VRFASFFLARVGANGGVVYTLRDGKVVGPVPGSAQGGFSAMKLLVIIGGDLFS